MKIREDFIGCVFVDGYRLFAGETVPSGSVVADWITGGSLVSRDEPVESTEIPVTEDESEHDDSEVQEPVDKPARADSKAEWFTYAESVDAIEENATIDDYSKADLVELVG